MMPELWQFSGAWSTDGWNGGVVFEGQQAE